MKMEVNDRELHEKFLACKRKHIVMITNHGIHQWQIIPGLSDTGGQNVFVNNMTDGLVEAGAKVTIVNRGGYKHPVTGKMRRGIDYKNSRQRLLFIEDGTDSFVRKEDMNDYIPGLIKFVKEALLDADIRIDLLVSHYWDAGKLGYLVKDELKKNARGSGIEHVWVPHSLGALKKKQVDSSRWEGLRIDERIETEKQILTKADKVAYTSFDIQKSLRQDYGCEARLFLPPSVDTKRFHPRDMPEDEEIWEFLDGKTKLSAEEIRKRHIITEISRTDYTKRKDILLNAFARVKKEFENVLLIVAVDRDRKDIADELDRIVKENGIEDDVIMVGSVFDELPSIYAVSCIYCTPSIMEGFGMSVQEAAATGVPAVASDLVPYAREYLAGDNPEEMQCERSRHPIKKGKAAMICHADDTDGFTEALLYMLKHPDIREDMAEKAFDITIPYFTWERRIRDFLKDVKITVNEHR